MLQGFPVKVAILPKGYLPKHHMRPFLAPHDEEKPVP
jgi:hypothetical protein